MLRNNQIYDVDEKQFSNIFVLYAIHQPVLSTSSSSSLGQSELHKFPTLTWA